jgi:FAD/FMN-containing dehydrogenase
MPATRPMRRPSCCARWTAPTRRCQRTSRGCASGAAGLGCHRGAHRQRRRRAARFWAGRKAAFPAVGRISPDYYCMDGTIPRKHLPGCCARSPELVRVRPARCQRVPRRRRQPAPADPLRRECPGRAGTAERSAARSSSCASRSAAPSPASTASAWRRSTRCARSSPGGAAAVP